MTARARPPAPAARPGLPQRADRPRGTVGARHREFDVHHWLVHYVASHAGADPSGKLTGVPFN